MSSPIGSSSWLSRWSCDRGRRPVFVEGAVEEHREEDVCPASGEADQGLGVVLSLGDLLVVSNCQIPCIDECGRTSQVGRWS